MYCQATPTRINIPASEVIDNDLLVITWEAGDFSYFVSAITVHEDHYTFKFEDHSGAFGYHSVRSADLLTVARYE